MTRIDSLENRILFASISGIVWGDVDNSKTIDRGETIRSGITVYLDENSNGALDTGEPSTTTNAKGAYTFTGLAAGTYTIGTVLDTASDPNLKQSYPGIIGTAASPFNIDLQFHTRMSAAAHNAFISAAQRWQSIITGDVEDIATSSGVIDDLQLNLYVKEIDGVHGTLGQTLSTDFRNTSSANPWLPYRNDLEFDVADFSLQAIEHTLGYTVLHEMGHALGFSDETWLPLGLITNDGLHNGSDYNGAHAIAEYNAMDGGASHTLIPLETGGGGGTAGAHWSEALFSNELMTGFINPEAINPLSRMTVGALEDIGYTVDYSAADTMDLTDLDIQGDYVSSINQTPGSNVAYAHNVRVASDTDAITKVNFGLYDNHAPIIRSFNVAPQSLTVGQSVAISARSVYEPDGDVIDSVSFYRESNGTAGLQGGTNGDTRIATVANPSDFIYRTTLDTTGLSAGQTILYARTRDVFGKGSTRTAVINLSTRPAVPADFRSGRDSLTQATLDWTDLSGGTASFRIEQSTSPGFETDVVRYTLPAGTTHLVISDLEPGVTYYFHIRAYNGLGTSSYTGRVSA